MAENLFLVFIALLFSGSFLLPLFKAFYRKWILLGLSLLFIVNLGFSSLAAVCLFTLFNYCMGRLLHAEKKRALLWFSVLLNILAILIFNSAGALRGIGSGETHSFSAKLPLLIGMSFYSLQHIAYLVDVFKGRINAESSILDFFLASLFFPKFICGPITLHQQMVPQFNNILPTTDLRVQGMNRILWGLFKKLVIADRLSSTVSSVFDYNDVLPGFTIFCGALFFTLQLYFDFSAYSDLAIGSAKLLGITLPENFDFPLGATSVTVFWRKWHQSLLMFFTNYVFYPLSFRFRNLKKGSIALGICVTFFLSGLWHGLGFTFLAWSICHMLFLLVELFFVKALQKRESYSAFIKFPFIVLTIILVSFSNLFFRSPGWESCMNLLGQLFRQGNFWPDDLLLNFLAPLAVGGHQSDLFNFYLVLFITLATLLAEKSMFSVFNRQRLQFWPSYLLALLILVLGVFGNGQRFIYMQF